MGRSLENIPDAELFPEFVRFFGVRRAGMLMGYAYMFAYLGVVDDLSTYRDYLMENGLSRSGAYDATLDFRRFREHVEQRDIGRDDLSEIGPVMLRISKMGR